MSTQDQIIRKSFGLKDQIRPELEKSYQSPLIDQIKAEGLRLQRGRLEIHLAEEFGFCYGVDRAIDYAYETKAKFPDRRIFLTNEIIHNPRVNSNLKEMGVQFLSGSYGDGSDFKDVGPEDVVIIPAFGTPVSELEEFQKKGCIMVDTTCGSVMSVWKRVESYRRDGFTSIIHGKYDHEETRATSSRADKFLIVRDIPQAQVVCDYIEGKRDRDAFYKEFQYAMSEGFDPDSDLGHVGCANQTTMLSSESLEIANMLRDAIQRQFGDSQVQKRFRHFDTICSATQDRQDAVMKMMQNKMDVMVVVGGFNSSNTAHLVEISLEYCPAFHVKDATCILSRDRIRHKKVFSSDIIETASWLPDGNIKIGITAGASTPNRVTEEVIQRIIEVA